MDWVIPLSIGFLGSFHCIGMCGPINLALPLGNRFNFKFFYKTFQFHIGRILTYTLLGAVFGGLGFGLKIAGLQQSISIAIGILMVLSVLLPKTLKIFKKTESFYVNLTRKVKLHLGRILGARNSSVIFVAGFLNGLLPCGLVYLGIAGAIATGNYFDGGIFMAFFGIGTLPAILGLLLFKGFAKPKSISFFKKAVPTFILVLGVLFILRGLNLDIPYVSPKISGEVSEIEQCD